MPEQHLHEQQNPHATDAGEFLYQIRRGPLALVYRDDNTEVHMRDITERYPGPWYAAYKIVTHRARYINGDVDLVGALVSRTALLPRHLQLRIAHCTWQLQMVNRQKDREIDAAIADTEREAALVQDAQDAHEIEREETIRRELENAALWR